MGTWRASHRRPVRRKERQNTSVHYKPLQFWEPLSAIGRSRTNAVGQLRFPRGHGLKKVKEVQLRELFSTES